MKKYNIIYADPPWEYKVWSKKGAGRTASSHYNIMTTNDIKRLPMQKICADSCILFLWVTYPNLIEGIETLKAWGFKFKTVAFTWIKLNKDGSPFTGMGYYTRANAEICLLGTKGKVIKRCSKNVKQVILSPREKHSKKPDEIRKRIEMLFGDLPRIELFARNKTDGWDVWGDEVESNIQFIGNV